ncbi:MAG: prolyl-tRNA synthetase [Parcubacteria group bacterium Gr01-1014_30]|nr:MAG: prolyl-tRNA synthetase [Parcubacteria group bacterium Gr01-1014_30]
MRQSQLFTKTSREAPKDEQALNAKLLMRAGFVHKNSAGVYSFLPLGWRVLSKIADIVREEMAAIGGQEIFLPVLVDKRYYKATGRANVDITFEAKGKSHDTGEFIIGWSHEEVLTEIASRFVFSFKDLPFAAYQIQTKARAEPRAKSGLLRGREFVMKDLYSFHASKEDLLRYYEEVKKAYFKIFKRCGLETIYTLASGGVFTMSNTHEFQVVAPLGEDTIYVCQKCKYAENKEVSKIRGISKCPKCSGQIQEKRSIEVGNIFPLGEKYSKAFDLRFTDKKGEKKYVVMGSYGIGLSRTMGAVVEVHHDQEGIIWPKEIAPFGAHLILLGEESKVKEVSESLYGSLKKHGVEVLYDDREQKTVGEKFADADLIGIPWRIVISERTLQKDCAELKKRNDKKVKLVKIKNVQQTI